MLDNTKRYIAPAVTIKAAPGPLKRAAQFAFDCALCFASAFSLGVLAVLVFRAILLY